MVAGLLHRSDARRARWEAWTDGPLLVAAVLFLGTYAWPILFPGHSRAAALCHTASFTIWVAFAVDLAVRLALSEHRVRFLRRNWPDLLVVAVPVLRPLRALQVVVALGVLARRGGAFARGRVVATVLAAAVLVSLVAALAVLDAERANPDANIDSFGDSAWWALTTATTVGYGDHYPTTVAGRSVAAGLMVTGIALLGVITAAMASWFVEKLSVAQRAEERAEERSDELVAEVRALRAEVRALRSEREGAI